MGIDPLTHKPLQPSTTTTDHPPSQEEEEQQPAKSMINSQEPNKERIETSMQSTITEAIREEEEDNKNNITGSPFDESMEEVNNGFCIDEVPLIEPHEILVPSLSTSSSSPSSSSSSLISPTTSSSSSSSCSSSYGGNNILEDMEKFMMPSTTTPTTFDDDFTNNIGFWDDYDFISSLDLLINEDTTTTTSHDDVVVTDVNMCLDQDQPSPNLLLDEDAWNKFGLL